NGMFAFAIWDRKTETLFLARDRTGEKPLYYCDSIPGLDLAFGSELKTLTAIPEFSNDIDHQSLLDFLSPSYLPQPQTTYRAVRQLEPAEWLRVEHRRHRRSKYWSVDAVAVDNRPEPQLIEELQTLCADAVKRRMLSDVPLGAFLSGGV